MNSLSKSMFMSRSRVFAISVAWKPQKSRKNGVAFGVPPFLLLLLLFVAVALLCLFGVTTASIVVNYIPFGFCMSSSSQRTPLMEEVNGFAMGIDVQLQKEDLGKIIDSV